jgi:ketosteroid isomerase-like protein
MQSRASWRLAHQVTPVWLYLADAHVPKLGHRLAACRLELVMPETQMTVERLAAFADAWNRHDLEALMGFMADDCQFHAIAGPDLLGRSFIGTAAVREGFAMTWQNFPDAAWVDADYFVCGDRGVMESTFKGTRTDGQRVEARMVDVFLFRGDKIVVKNAFRKDRPLQSAPGKAA